MIKKILGWLFGKKPLTEFEKRNRDLERDRIYYEKKRKELKGDPK